METQQPEINNEQDMEAVGNRVIALLKELFSCIESMNTVHPCRQFQMVRMDVASAIMQIEDLLSNGPKEPFEEIPLEQSEIKEEEGLVGEQTEMNVEVPSEL